MARHRRNFSPEVLAADPSLSGRPLAQPWERGLALFIDGLILLVPTLGAAVGSAYLALRGSDPAAAMALVRLFQEEDKDPATAQTLLRDVAPLLVRIDAPGLPPEVAVAVAEGDLEGAAARLGDCDFMFALDIGGSRPPPLKPGTVKIEIEKLIPATVRGLALLGVPGLYFTLFLAWGRGSTVGKLLLGLRVARLDGRRLSLWEALERFGACFSIPGTVGFGLIELWRDPNRRLAHDRAADTVVLKVRQRRRARNRSSR